jgi:hypothetical protein
MCVLGILVHVEHIQHISKIDTKLSKLPLKFFIAMCAPVYAVSSNLRGSSCIFGTVGIISVLDGDRNKVVLVAKSFVLLELQ